MNTAITGIRDGKNITWSDFSELIIPIPEIDDLHEILEYISQYEQQKEIFKKEKLIIQEYKDSLIGEAITGKIDVRDFEIPESTEKESYEDLEEELSIAAEDEAEYQTEEIEE